MRIEIRTGTVDDAEAIAGVIQTAFRDVAEKFALTPQNAPSHPSNCTGDWIRSDLNTGFQYLVAEDDGDIVGCFAYKKITTLVAEAQRLAVTHRGKKIADLLNRAVIDRAVEDGIETTRISIVAQHEALRRWYLRMGFIERESRAFDHLPFEVQYLELRLNKADH